MKSNKEIDAVGRLIEIIIQATDTCPLHYFDDGLLISGRPPSWCTVYAVDDFYTGGSEVNCNTTGTDMGQCWKNWSERLP